MCSTLSFIAFLVFMVFILEGDRILAAVVVIAAMIFDRDKGSKGED